MNTKINGDNSMLQTSSKAASLQVNDNLSSMLANQIKISSELDIESSNKEEFVLSVQYMDDEMHLENDIEKEYNLSVEDYSKIKFLEHPCPKDSLTKFRDEKLKKITAQIYKRIENPGFGPTIDLSSFKVVYEYAFFLQGNEEPFASSRFNRNLGTIHISKSLFTLAGIHDAIMTMKFKEASLFWISYDLMYGALGIKPRIPPKADILARIKIAKLFDNDGNEIMLKISKFEETLHSATKAYSLAKTHFSKNDYNSTIALYKKWINTLENTHLADDEQENETKHLLIKMYLNLCVCYNKIENPQKSCLAMQELERLTSITHCPRALYAKGRALMMLNHDNDAQKFIEAALRLDPQNSKILKTLDELKAIKLAKREHSANMKDLERTFNREIEDDLHGKKHLIDKFLQSLPN